MINRIEDLDSGVLAPQFEQLRDKTLELAAVAREKLGQGSDALRDYTIRQPTRAIGIALGMGVLLGWLIKRR
jgi:ElaB/YqjD/DUF883 family membrane-anchored ribosome-binding protein